MPSILSISGFFNFEGSVDNPLSKAIYVTDTCAEFIFLNSFSN